MNAAVETSRTETQRRRPQSLGPKPRGPSATAGAAADQSLAVLIRVPNLDAPRANTRAGAIQAASSEATGTDERATPQNARPQSIAPGTVSLPVPNSSSQLIGWGLRMMILAAAVGLVVLAYRIINGPASSEEMPDTTGSAKIVAGDDDEQTRPAAVTPAPHADEIAAPSTLAPPKLQLESPPEEVAPVEGNLTIDPVQPTDDERRPWATNVQMEEQRADGSLRTARSEWDTDYDGASSRDRQPPRAEAPADGVDESWDANQQIPGNYDYPETDRSTWRDASYWETASSRAPPPQYRGTTVPSWNEAAPYAQRPREAGVARLQGDIESPPLRRDDERNRSSIY